MLIYSVLLGFVISQTCDELKGQTFSERTFIAAKPDAIQRGLLGEIIVRFERKGFQLVALKMVSPPRSLLELHYQEHSERPFFQSLVDYMSSGPIVAMVWSGPNIVLSARTLIGSTKPDEAAPGTIRGDFAIQVGRNLVHGSDSIESAEREIKIWFDPAEINQWSPALDHWINKDN